jgi:hypothetical protein
MSQTIKTPNAIYKSSANQNSEALSNATFPCGLEPGDVVKLACGDVLHVCYRQTGSRMHEVRCHDEMQEPDSTKPFTVNVGMIVEAARRGKPLIVVGDGQEQQFYEREDPMEAVEQLARRFYASIKEIRRSQKVLKDIDSGVGGRAFLSIGGYDFVSDDYEGSDGQSPEAMELGKQLIQAKAERDYENAQALLLQIKALELPAQ